MQSGASSFNVIRIPIDFELHHSIFHNLSFSVPSLTISLSPCPPFSSCYVLFYLCFILSCQDQAFGQPFFEELKSDEANVITILMWPVMNLMLVNLLIAIMNDRCVCMCV